MRVLVAGATGALGRPLVRALTAHGHDVIGLTRDAGRAVAQRSAWADAVVADVMEREALLAATRAVRADAVIHQVTALAKPPIRHADMAKTNALRIRGTENLLAAAAAVGAHRFVTQSFLGGYGYGDHGSRLLTEEDPFGPPGASPGLERTIEGMRSAEQQAFNATGIDGISLRYGLFYGPGGPLESMLRMLRRRRFPIPRGGGGVLSYVYLPDAATATVAALEQGDAGQAYNVVDDEPVQWGTFTAAVAKVFGTPPPPRVPDWMLRAAPYAGALMFSTIKLSNAKAKAELDWTPMAPTYRQGLDLARESVALD